MVAGGATRWDAGRGAVRARLPAIAAEAYLNTGGAGPLPDVACEAMQVVMDQQLARGRMSAAGVDAARERQEVLRAAVGGVVGRAGSEVAIMQSSTHAMNAVIWGMRLAAGDEVVTTGMEHPGLAVPLRAAADAAGARVVVAEVGDGSVDLEAVMGAACTERTRLVALSHVSWMTGAVLDVPGAARAAGAVGALTLVDGAQAAGAVHADPAGWGVDAYAMPAQKWLLGPEGLGALWVRPGRLEEIAPTVMGYESGVDHGWDGSVALHPDCRRLEVSTFPEILIAGWSASLAWLEGIGWERIARDTARAARACREALDGVGGVRLDPPLASESGLVAFSVPGRDPEEVAIALAERGVIVRPLPGPGALRASCGFFTNAGDIDRLAEALAGLPAC